MSRTGQILARTTYRDRVPMVFFVEGGLHYLKGNSAPYFSLTYTAHRKGFPSQCWSGGAGHDEIRRRFGDRFDDLAAMHLSDIDGAPMHAEANGWYHLAGALGGLGERYTVLTSKRPFPKARADLDPARPWDTTDYREPTQDEALQLFAEYVRIPLEEARGIAEEIGHLASIGDLARPHPRQRWAEIMETMRPRWKREAQACIAKHGLTVYGDPWPVQAVEG